MTPLAAISDDVAQLVSLVGFGAAAVALLLGVLLLAQRRDLTRLHAWRVLEPGRGDASAPVGPTAAPAQPASGAPVASAAAAAPRPATATGLTPAQRVTLDRPALQRVTTERAALEEPTALERAWRALREPRHPLLIAAGAFLVGIGIFLGALRLVSGDGSEGTEERRGIVPSEVSVTVLNGTGASALGDKVSDDVEANGFALAGVDVIDRNRKMTLVLYAPGQRKEAKLLANDLGVDRVRPIDNASQRAAGDADVVVVAGEDRAGP